VRSFKGKQPANHNAWHNNCNLYSMTAIKVFVGSQHEVVRYGLRALFDEYSSRTIEIVGEAEEGFGLIEKCTDSRADVYILNLHMPGLNGIDAVPEIKRKKPNSEMIIVSPFYDKIVLEEILSSGAKGFVLNRSAGSEIIEAVEETAGGKYYLCSEISDDILQPILTKICNGSRNGRYRHGLTERQREILKLICDGLTEKEIGEKLCISYHTVHVHTTNIMRTLDLHTKADLVKYGIRNRLVPLPVSVPAYSRAGKEAFA
jgi:two-component system, NarL family, response regulator NreC